ncbi:DPP IV N-terminal domain-containing protein [Hyphomonas sp.]|uniref:S9 family peptidase n=1 Tax=Hyphomonas sp. TaxID=87 RepID=UPI003527B9DD
MRPAIYTLFTVIVVAVSAIVPSMADPLQNTLETKILTNAPDTLPLDRLYASPSLSGPTARMVKYSPDGTRVTFLKSRVNEQNRFDLWQYDVATGKQSMLVDSLLLEPNLVELSEEEKALRERKRISGTIGIADYSWGVNDTILIPLGGDLHLVTLTPNGPMIRQLTHSDAFEYDARVSPGGTYVSFVRDGAVYAIEIATGKETRLTPEADPEHAISYGVSEFVAQEEMKRFTGYWWSPDERYVAFTEVDESEVEIIPRFDIEADKVTVIEQRYPRAGRPNARVAVYVNDLRKKRTDKIYETGPGSYLARVYWTTSSLWFLTVNRDQTEITYNRTDSRPWRIWSPYTEQNSKWVNLSKDFRELPDGRILLTTEDGGMRHAIAIPPNGHGDTDIITPPDQVLDSIETVSPDGKTLFYTGYADTVLERHLYSVPLDKTAPPVRITEAGRFWDIKLSPDGQSFIGTSSSPAQPPQTGLYQIDGSLIGWIEENALDKDHPYAPYLSSHMVPEYGTLTAEDGQDLYYSLLKPPGFNPNQKYPAIIEVYGGPHVQTVKRAWGSLSDQFLAGQGYIVFRLDNRGSDNRGRQFEDVIYHRTGGPEVRDQLVGVSWLKAQPYVDAGRIAIQGGSYGGYMTLMTILQAPKDTFAAAVSSAPVTDWSLYDTFYTERYMGTPERNPDGYAASNVLPIAGNLNTPLLLIHGMADDNVTFDNSTRLMATLQQEKKSFELMTYPGQRHGIRGEALQTHQMKTRLDFLDRHLKARADETAPGQDQP